MKNIKKNLPLLFLILLTSLFQNILSFKEWWEGSKILELTNENFLDHVGKDKYVVVKFYTRWCGYCRIMSPEYDKLQENLLESRKDVLIARLEGSINEDISLLYEISSFPKIVLFEPGSTDIKANFRGNRVAKLMEKWISVIAPPLKNFGKENEDNKDRENKENKSNDKEKDNKDNKNILDSSKVNSEVEYFRKELNDMKNKMSNMEQDIESLKTYTKKIDEGIKEARNNNNNNDKGNNNDDKGNNSRFEGIKMKIDGKKSKGNFFENYALQDIIIFLCIGIFFIGAYIVFRNIFFKTNKSLPVEEHPKV